MADSCTIYNNAYSKQTVIKGPISDQNLCDIMEGVKFASSILVRAVELDKDGRYTESLVCYQEGLNLLMDSLKMIPEENTDVRLKLRARVEGKSADLN